MINTEISQYRRLLTKVAIAVEDSNRLAISRTAYRGFGPGGAVAAKEIERAIKPLEESVEEGWLEMNDQIALVLAKMELKTNSILKVESLVDLHPLYRDTERLKDSVTSLIQKTMDGSTR